MTIAIPFYGNLAYLKQAIDSVLQQTEQDFALIIADDCGPEGDEASAWIAALNDQRISYARHTSNLGLAGNWNACIRMAQTDLVTLLHADDLLHPSYVEKMVATATSYPDAALLFCRAEIIDNCGHRKFSFPDYIKTVLAPARKFPLILSGDRALSSLLNGCYIICPTICYRRSLLDDLQFSTRWRMVVDFDFYARVFYAGKKAIGIVDRLYYYRRHEQNQTSLLTAAMVRFEEESQFYSEVAKETIALGWALSAQKATKKIIIKLNLLHCTVSDLVKGQFRAAAQKLRFFLSLFR